MSATDMQRTEVVLLSALPVPLPTAHREKWQWPTPNRQTPSRLIEQKARTVSRSRVPCSPTPSPLLLKLLPYRKSDLPNAPHLLPQGLQILVLPR